MDSRELILAKIQKNKQNACTWPRLCGHTTKEECWELDHYYKNMKKILATPYVSHAFKL